MSCFVPEGVVIVDRQVWESHKVSCFVQEGVTKCHVLFRRESQSVMFCSGGCGDRGLVGDR